jgi:fermentation-respiration switch protein FrsA (DUF1100 family)
VIERHTLGLPADKLALVLHLPPGPGPFPCVLACHGLSASKDSDKYLLLGAELPRAGLALARFDFRGCGESSGVEAETTVATRIGDARAVLAFLGTHDRLDGRLGLLGSSLGGFVALHVARGRQDAPPVVTWNAPAELSELAAKDPATYGGIGPAFVREFREGRHRAVPAGVARHLVIQGEADEVVAPAHGVALHARAAEPRDLLTIPGADHRLTDMTHRWAALTVSRDWFLRFLGRAPD